MPPIQKAQRQAPAPTTLELGITTEQALLAAIGRAARVNNAVDAEKFAIALRAVKER